MYVLKKDDIKIYCKFNKEKQPIDKVICKMFYDFTEKKTNNKNLTHLTGKTCGWGTPEPCCYTIKILKKELTKYKDHVMIILL